MLPRSLTKRVFLAFAALGFAMLVTVGGSLFLVLRNAHQDNIKQSLENQVVVVEASLKANPVSGQRGFEVRIRNLTTNIVDEGGLPRGVIGVVAGNPSSVTLPSPPPTGVRNFTDTYRVGGKQYVYVEPNATETGTFRFVFAVPDTSAQQALGDISRTMWIVVVILLGIGLPIAWLLSRSISGPMRRLAQAAADLPTSTSEQPVPIEGPTEVRVLTERFNAMAHELASTRHEESAMLANLRHIGRTSRGGGSNHCRGGRAIGAAHRRTGRGRAIARGTRGAPARTPRRDGAHR